ncbi:MAG: MFS transporter [Acidimicrobiia bacterium]
MANSLSSALSRRPLLAAVVYTGMGVLPLFLVSAQILQLERGIGFGVGQLGLATATFFGSAALAANPAGRVVARVGPGRSLRIGGLLTLAACVIAGTATTGWLLPIATAVGGVSNGLIQVAANLAIFDGVAVGRQGLAFGAKQASVPMASVLAGISLPMVGLVFGWRWVFAIAALLALILAISAPHLDMAKAAERNEGPIGRPPRSLLLLAVAGICGAMAGNGLSLFIVPSAVDIGIEEAAAGAVLAVCSLLVVAVRLGAGWAVDRRGSNGYAEMAWMAGAGTVGAIVLATSAAPAVYLVAMPIAVLGAWGWPGIFFFSVVHSYPEFPARASGLVLSSNLTGTVIGPLVVGSLAGRGNYPAAWGFVAVTAAIATVAFGASNRLRTRSPVSS